MVVRSMDVWNSLWMNILLIAWIAALAALVRGLDVGGRWTRR